MKPVYDMVHVEAIEIRPGIWVPDDIERPDIWVPDGINNVDLAGLLDTDLAFIPSGRGMKEIIRRASYDKDGIRMDIMTYEHNAKRINSYWAMFHEPVMAFQLTLNPRGPLAWAVETTDRETVFGDDVPKFYQLAKSLNKRIGSPWLHVDEDHEDELLTKREIDRMLGDDVISGLWHDHNSGDFKDYSAHFWAVYRWFDGDCEDDYLESPYELLGTLDTRNSHIEKLIIPLGKEDRAPQIQQSVSEAC